MRKKRSPFKDYIPVGLVGAMMLVLVLVILVSRTKAHENPARKESRPESRTERSDLSKTPLSEDPLPQTEDPQKPGESTADPGDPGPGFSLPKSSIEETTEKKKELLTEEDFFESLRNMLEYFNRHNMKFSRNGGGKRLKGSKGFNCATYVSWTLQEMDLIPDGKLMWFSKKPHGAAYTYIKKHPEHFEILHPDQPAKKCPDLRPGDICGFTINGYAPHTTVYAGKDDKGHMLWYSGGGDYRKMRENGFSATRFKYYEQNNDVIYTIVRIRYDQIGKKGKNSNGIVKIQ